MDEAEPRPDEAFIRVEVAYASETEQRLLSLDVAPGARVEGAIRASGILDLFPEIDLATQSVGIFAEPVSLDTPLGAGDRIEIYRPLKVDPKAARRARARAQRRGGVD